MSLGDSSFVLFMTAATILAITPGPGIFYVLTRSIRGGRKEGFTSSLGTAVGGMAHVLAAALGLSAVLMTSAVAFQVVKYAGAIYLVYLGLRTLLRPVEKVGLTAGPAEQRHAFYQGIVTEVLNPKTALFFLAFIPQFVDPAGAVLAQFILFGCISVCLNTSVDLVVAFFAGPLGQRLADSVRFRRGQQLFSGCSLVALGAYAAVSGGEGQ
jgi:threonine/homoserine/homoserine lactone efflux protein